MDAEEDLRVLAARQAEALEEVTTELLCSPEIVRCAPHLRSICTSFLDALACRSKKHQYIRCRCLSKIQV